MKNPLAADLDHILEHTRDLWDELRGERIFITGGTGFFGCWLLESLIWANDCLNLNCRATVLTRSLDQFRVKAPHLAGHKVVSVIQGDVRTFVFPTGQYTQIIHAATESNAKLSAENPLQVLDTIVEGTRHTLEFAKTCGAQNFLLTSSGAVYGKQPPEMTHIPEEYTGAPDPLEAKSAYGEGKRMAEHLCTLYANAQLKPKIARCFAFVGPHLPFDLHFAIGNFIRDALNGGPVVIKGDGTPRRSYLYTADLVIWVWTILLCGQSLRPYNVGSEESLSIMETAETVVRCVNPALTVDVRRISHPNRFVEQYVPLTQRAFRELKLQTRIDLQSAIQRTLTWIRSR
jgi:nucleoside-diphosphate-sugar epimerase